MVCSSIAVLLSEPLFLLLLLTSISALLARSRSAVVSSRNCLVDRGNLSLADNSELADARLLLGRAADRQGQAHRNSILLAWLRDEPYEP
jgi:hypothetical protein